MTLLQLVFHFGMTKSWSSLPPFPRASHSIFWILKQKTAEVMPTGNHHLSNQVGPRVCVTITQEGQSQQQYWQKVSFSSEKKRQGRGAEDNLKLPKVKGGKFILPAPVPAFPLSGPPFGKPYQPRLAKYCLCSFCNFPMFWKVA